MEVEIKLNSTENASDNKSDSQESNQSPDKKTNNTMDSESIASSAE